MTSRHRAGLTLLTLATLTALTVSGAAQTVEDAPLNCCAEIYWAGWELGQLRSIASYPTPDYRQDASFHMQRLSTTLQAANAACCRFCEAWVEWPQIQDGIRATTNEVFGSSQSSAMETRRALHDWAEARPARLLEGLNRCDLEDGMPCKWLGLVDCARAYFQLGEQLGNAMLAASAASDGVEAGLFADRNARQDGLEGLDRAAGLLAALRTGNVAPGSTGARIRCDYLWAKETGAESLLSEVLGQPDLYTDAQLAAKAMEAHRLILSLLVDGRPDQGISPCPVGDANHHAECELAAEHGHLGPEQQER